MFKRLEEISVDWLRENHYDAYFFGLGFIQVKIDPLHRVHFYHPNIPSFVEQPHDHRYNFISTVLRGRLTNTIWEETRRPVEASQQGWYSNATCKRDDAQDDPAASSDSGLLYGINLQRVGEFTVLEGSSYYISKDSFHTVEPDFSVGPCVTSIVRTEPEKEMARIIQTDDEMLCPFSQPLDDATMWQIIQECLQR